jgi:hypothetical protein
VSAPSSPTSATRSLYWCGPFTRAPPYTISTFSLTPKPTNPRQPPTRADTKFGILRLHYGT